MTKAEIAAYNRGIGEMIAIAEAAADALCAKITKAPTRYSYAIEALQGIVEAGGELLMPLSPDDTVRAASTPCPGAPAPAKSAQSDSLEAHNAC